MKKGNFASSELTGIFLTGNFSMQDRLILRRQLLTLIFKVLTQLLTKIFTFSFCLDFKT